MAKMPTKILPSLSYPWLTAYDEDGQRRHLGPNYKVLILDKSTFLFSTTTDN